MFTGVPADRATAAAERARRRLAGGRFADVRWTAETSSTNSDAMALARNGAPEGVVVVADHQTGGRGRQGRVWVAPPEASLLVTVLLRPPARVVGLAAMAVAVAMAEAVEDVTGWAPGLKWPNDLVAFGDGGNSGGRDLTDRKLAGILAEADWPPGTTASGGWREPSPDERLAVVVGVGINVNWPAELPDELSAIATALDHLVGHEVDRVDLLVAFLERLESRYDQLVRQGPPAMLDEWRRRSATLGRVVRVDLGTRDVEGTAVDLTDEGHLVVETPDGDRHTFAVGDVVHLRPR
jgi:BirA family biotin operon repressor/biotin-[acetyl-CoA-carboxylase] ligase